AELGGDLLGGIAEGGLEQVVGLGQGLLHLPGRGGEGGVHLVGGRGQHLLQLARGQVHGAVDGGGGVLQRLGNIGRRRGQEVFHGLAGGEQAPLGVVDGIGDGLREAAHPLVDVVGTGGEALGQR